MNRYTPQEHEGEKEEKELGKEDGIGGNEIGRRKGWIEREGIGGVEKEGLEGMGKEGRIRKDR